MRESEEGRPGERVMGECERARRGKASTPVVADTHVTDHLVTYTERGVREEEMERWRGGEREGERGKERGEKGLMSRNVGQ